MPTQKFIDAYRNGYPIREIYYNGEYTFDDMKNEAYDIHKKLKEKGFQGEMTINVLFPTKTGHPNKWRPIKEFTDINEDFILDETEVLEDYWGKHKFFDVPDHFTQFQILVAKKNKNQGGNNKYNDCLYNSLNEIIPNILVFHFPTPQSLKTWCELKRDDKVPIEKIPKIEKKLKDYKINVIGEYKYTSTKEAKYTITLKLKYEHYSLYRGKLNFVKGIVYEDKEPIIYKHLNLDEIRLYNGSGYATINYNKFIELKTLFYQQKSSFILIKMKDETLKKTYKNFIFEADVLKEKTNGKYNLYQTGTQLKAAVKRFYDLNKTLIADEIDCIEGEWIRNAMKNPLCWAIKGYKGPGYSYDVNSAYSRILSDQRFLIPIKRGIFKKITQEELNNMVYFEYGIYKCKINIKNYKLMKTHHNNYYTHFDLTRAKELNYEIIVTNDNNPNLLSYADKNSKINGSIIFKEFVNELYELKKQYNDDKIMKNIFKLPLNIIWGALCEKVYYKQIVNKNNPTIKESGQLEHLIPTDEKRDNYRAKILSNEQYYNTNFARLGPFLLGRIRLMMSKIIEPHIDKIVRMHTDGFTSTEKIKFKQINKYSINNVKIGNDLGDIKFEGYFENIHIININKIKNLITNEILKGKKDKE